MFRCMSVLIVASLCLTLEGCSNRTSVTVPIIERPKDHVAVRSLPVESVLERHVQNSSLNCRVWGHHFS
jgi:hypothetical protein